MSLAGNYDLRDEIKAYWSERAATFDDQPGHEIFSEGEREAWQALFMKHLGRGDGRRAVDLACGTAVISHILDDIGFSVTGIDWAEPMLARARAKAKNRSRSIRFLMGDAENTMEPDCSADVVTNRHLVWTLVDPEAAFREWHRILKPGGRLLIIDGDFVNPSALSGLFAWLASWSQTLGLSKGAKRHGPGALAETHRSILSRVYFSGGARAEVVARLLETAGFTNVRIDYDLKTIHREQRRNFPLFEGLQRATQHRYAISADKPGP
jgi:ubiquinone/menaquinone biosynthesis C-methylase UbiE